MVGGTPGRIRTRDPLLRRQPLYPSELQGRVCVCNFSVATRGICGQGNQSDAGMRVAMR